MPIRVFIVDDRPEMRLLLKLNLEQSTHDIVVCGEADTAEAALEGLERACADLVITDVSLPRMSGIELVERIRLQYPALQILVASVHRTDHFEESARKAGAHEVISKSELDKVPEMVKNMMARSRPVA